MKDYVETPTREGMPDPMRSVLDRLRKGGSAYRQYLEDTAREKAANGGFSTEVPKTSRRANAPQAIPSEERLTKTKQPFPFTKSRINDYTPPQNAEGKSGFEVDAETLTNLTNSEAPELQNLKVEANASGNRFFVQADNNAGNKYLSELTKPKDHIQMDATTLKKVLNSENSVIQNAHISVDMVDEEHASFEERPYRVFTSNKRAYNLIRAISIDITIPYEGAIIDEVSASASPTVSLQSDNVVEFPKETSKIRFSGLSRLAKAAAVVLATVVTPWQETPDMERSIAAVNSASITPSLVFSESILPASRDTALNAQTDIIMPSQASQLPSLDFIRPVWNDHSPETLLTELFQVNSTPVVPVIMTTHLAPQENDSVTYVTQMGDTLWGIVEQEFEQQGLDKGEGYANMLARMDQYVQANPSLAYQPGMLSSEFSLTVPTADATRADCRWNRTRNVCQLSL